MHGLSFRIKKSVGEELVTRKQVLQNLSEFLPLLSQSEQMQSAITQKKKKNPLQGREDTAVMKELHLTTERHSQQDLYICNITVTLLCISFSQVITYLRLS